MGPRPYFSVDLTAIPENSMVLRSREGAHHFAKGDLRFPATGLPMKVFKEALDENDQIRPYCVRGVGRWVC